MRVNIYAEEMPDDIEQGVVLFQKAVEGGGTFTALRFYLHLPVTTKGYPELGEEQIVQRKGPFMHHPGDDDSSAVTFWGKKDMRPMLRRALALLDEHAAKREVPFPAVVPTAETATVLTELHGGVPVGGAERLSAPATASIAPKTGEATGPFDEPCPHGNAGYCNICGP